MKINWKVRIKNKAFWLAIIPACLLVAEAVAGLFGLRLNTDHVAAGAVEVVKAVFALLSVLGVVNDPTTAGLNDSERAMTYEKPD